MKKAMRFTLWLSLFIVVIFSIGMAMTFVNDWLQSTGFFGDTKFVPYKSHYGDMVTETGMIDLKWEWGVRHYWYHWMCVLLFIVMVVRVVIWSEYYWNDEQK